LKILVIGYGSIGKRHIENLSGMKNIKIIVCTNQKIDRFLQQNNCLVLKNLKQCINEKPNAAIISNVTSNHIKTATLLASHKIHLFIEKPLSHSFDGIKILVNTIKKFNLITMMGCQLRFHPCIKLAKKYILSNQLGKIMSVQIENGSFLPDWHVDKDYSQSYSAKKSLGGGVVLTCIHEIDYLCWFFGYSTIISAMTNKVSNLELDVEDIASVLLQFKNKMIAELHLDYFQKPIVRTCKIIGTKGTLELDLVNNSCRKFDFKKNKWLNVLNLPKYDMNCMYIDELAHFVNCIRYNKKAVNDIDEGLKILKIALSIKKSSKTKRVIIHK